MEDMRKFNGWIGVWEAWQATGEDGNGDEIMECVRRFYDPWEAVKWCMQEYGVWGEVKFALTNDQRGVH